MPERKPPLMLAPLLVALVGVLLGANHGGAAEYVGGTLASLEAGAGGLIITTDPQHLIFQTKKRTVRVPYDKVNLLEYGQKVDRRYLSAVFISPLLILAKKRTHFLTVGYSTEDGAQAMVLRVNKESIRAVLVSLEVRTGLKVVYQDEEARKAGKG